jgi:phosphoenolpyruvate---glycerone phosphotransferase subunit DhaL
MPLAQRFAAALAIAKRGAARLEVELNAADRALGDGDTGTMVARLIGAMAVVQPSQDTSDHDYLAAIAKAGAQSTGSSLGTLIVGALLAVAAELRTEPQASATDLLDAACEAIMRRGRAEPGAKTILDALIAIKAALPGDPETDPLFTARDAARTALASFRPRQSTLGRARLYAEASIGKDDPGMLAVVLLLDLLCAPNLTRH